MFQLRFHNRSRSFFEMWRAIDGFLVVCRGAFNVRSFVGNL